MQREEYMSNLLNNERQPGDEREYPGSALEKKRKRKAQIRLRVALILSLLILAAVAAGIALFMPSRKHILPEDYYAQKMLESAQGEGWSEQEQKEPAHQIPDLQLESVWLLPQDVRDLQHKFDHADLPRCIRAQMYDGQAPGMQDRGKILLIDITAEFSGQKPRIEGIGIVVHDPLEIVSVQYISIDKDHISLSCPQFRIRCMEPEGPLLHIVEFDPIVPVPRDMIAGKQSALVIVAYKGKAAGVL